MLSTCYHSFPSIDAPHAPLADAYEVDDFLFDVDCEKYYAVRLTNNAFVPVKNETAETDTSDSEEEMEQDEMDADSDDALNHDSFSEEEHEKLNKNEEYPEFAKDGGEAVAESDSYDFAVMDTDKDTDGANRKRKADTPTARRAKLRR